MRSDGNLNKMRFQLLFGLLLLYSCQESTTASDTPVVHLLKGVTAYPDTFTNTIEMAYEFELQIENGKEDIWFLTSSPRGERYALTDLEVTKTIKPDSILGYHAIIDRVGHNYRMEANKGKTLLVRVHDLSEVDIIPDTITFHFRYYRDSIYFDRWQMKVSVPVKAQLK